MVVIYLFLSKALNWNTLVTQSNKYHHHTCTVTHDMLCFNRLYLITEKKMHLQHLHIENE